MRTMTLIACATFWLGTLFAAGVASAQCAAEPGWFPHATTPEPDFHAPTDFDCDFHKWAWQEFLFLTKPGKEGRPVFLDMPTADDLFSFSLVPRSLSDIPGGRALILKPRIIKTADPTEFGEIRQAGSKGVLVDQAGHALYYQSQVNAAFYQFIRGNNLHEPAVYKQKAPGLSFPKGCVEIKSSWWIVPTGRTVQDYFTIQARINPLKCKGGQASCQGDDIVVDLDHSTPVTVALVGLHVVGVVEGHPEFVWATFEHRNNAPDLPVGVGPHSTTPVSGQGKTFYKAGTVAKGCNVSNSDRVALDQSSQTLTVQGDPSGVTNVFRQFAWGGDPASPDAANIQALNASVQGRLNAEGSVWQNYDLRGSTWLPGSTLRPGIGGNSLRNRAVGSVSVANSTMETFSQGPRSNCFACHDTAAEAVGGKLILPASNLNVSHLVKNGLVQRLQAESLEAVGPLPGPAGSPAQTSSAVARPAVATSGPIQPPLRSYDDVKKMLNKFCDDNGISIDRAPHFRFWNAMTYEDFTSKDVPHIFNSATGEPYKLKILVMGKPDESNIILALRGQAGTIFDPNNIDPGAIGRMPGNGSPMPPELIDALAAWIKSGCPNATAP